MTEREGPRGNIYMPPRESLETAGRPCLQAMSRLLPQNLGSSRLTVPTHGPEDESSSGP